MLAKFQKSRQRLISEKLMSGTFVQNRLQQIYVFDHSSHRSDHNLRYNYIKAMLEGRSRGQPWSDMLGGWILVIIAIGPLRQLLKILLYVGYK